MTFMWECSTIQSLNPVPIGLSRCSGVYRRGAEKAGENIGKELKPVYIDYRENQKISMRF